MRGFDVVEVSYLLPRRWERRRPSVTSLVLLTNFLSDGPHLNLGRVILFSCLLLSESAPSSDEHPTYRPAYGTMTSPFVRVGRQSNSWASHPSSIKPCVDNELHPGRHRFRPQ